MYVNKLSLSDPFNEGRIVEVFTKSSGKLAQNDDDVMLRLNVFYRYAIHIHVCEDVYICSLCTQCVCVCVCACVRACMRVCTCVSVCLYMCLCV